MQRLIAPCRQYKADENTFKYGVLYCRKNTILEYSKSELKLLRNLTSVPSNVKYHKHF